MFVNLSHAWLQVDLVQQYEALALRNAQPSDRYTTMQGQYGPSDYSVCGLFPDNP